MEFDKGKLVYDTTGEFKMNGSVSQLNLKYVEKKDPSILGKMELKLIKTEFISAM